MTAADFATVGYIDQWMRVLHAQLQALVPAPAPAPVVIYSAAKLALVLDVHVDTVGRWLSKGKTGKNGQLVKLQAFRLTSEPRIPWPAVLAYHRGEDFDLDTLPAPLLAAELALAPPLSLSPAQEPPVLRVA